MRSGFEQTPRTSEAETRIVRNAEVAASAQHVVSSKISAAEGDLVLMRSCLESGIQCAETYQGELRYSEDFNHALQ